MSDDLLDTLTRHQIFIQRLASGQADIVGSELDKLIKEVESKLEGNLTDFQQFRLLVDGSLCCCLEGGCVGSGMMMACVRGWWRRR